MPAIDLDALAGMLVAALALFGGPGPATLSVAATSAVFGVRLALPYYVGVCCGTSTIVVLVKTGVTGLVFAVPGVAPVLVFGAGLYIFYLAYRIATAPTLRSAEEAGTPPPALVGYLFAIANPKGYAAIGAVFAGFTLLADNPVQNAIVKVAILSCMVVFVNTVWLLTGSALSRLFQSEASARVLNIAFAVLLVLSVIVLVI